MSKDIVGNPSNEDSFLRQSAVESIDISSLQVYVPDLVCFGPATPEEIALYNNEFKASLIEGARSASQNTSLRPLERNLSQRQFSAALTIQRACRQYQRRRSKKSTVILQSSPQNLLVKQTSLLSSFDITRHIVCIQKYIRSACEQKRFHQKRTVVLKLQVYVRRILARTQFVAQLRNEMATWHEIEQKIFEPWTPEDVAAVGDTTTQPDQFSALLRRFQEHNRRWERWMQTDISQTAHIAKLRGLTNEQYQNLVKDLSARRQQLRELNQERDMLMKALAAQEHSEPVLAAERESLVRRHQEQLQELQRRLQHEMEHISFPKDFHSIQELWDLNDNFEPNRCTERQLCSPPEHRAVTHSSQSPHPSPGLRGHAKTLQWADEQSTGVSTSPLHHSPNPAALPPPRPCLRIKRTKLWNNKENAVNEKEHASAETCIPNLPCSEKTMT